MNLHPNIALITGAAKRVGQTIALQMAAAGWDIALHYGKSSHDAQNTLKEIEKQGQRAIGIQADLNVPEEVAMILPKCISELGLPTCLINNAALFEYDQPASFSYANFENHMRINLAAPLILSEQLYKAYQSSSDTNACGVIIHLLDQKLDNLNPDYFSYTLSKAGLEAAMKMQAMQFAPLLRVVGIAPGITLVSGDQTPSSFQKAHQMTPLGKSSTAEDIAKGVLYVCSALAMTGTTLQIDGGQHLLGSPRDIMFLNH